MDTITIEEAEARLAELVTRDGKPVLDIGPDKRTGGFDREGLERFKKQRGIDRIFTYIASDFDDPLPEGFLITPGR